MRDVAAFATVRRCLIVTLLGEVDAQGWPALQRDVLARVAGQRVRGVVLDVSAVQVLDGRDAQSLAQTLDMCRLLGAKAVVVGLSAALVATLVELEAPVERLAAAASVEAALDVLWAG